MSFLSLAAKSILSDGVVRKKIEHNYNQRRHKVKEFLLFRQKRCVKRKDPAEKESLKTQERAIINRIMVQKNRSSRI